MVHYKISSFRDATNPQKFYIKAEPHTKVGDQYTAIKDDENFPEYAFEYEEHADKTGKKFHLLSNVMPADARPVDGDAPSWIEITSKNNISAIHGELSKKMSDTFVVNSPSYISAYGKDEDRVVVEKMPADLSAKFREVELNDDHVESVTKETFAKLQQDHAEKYQTATTVACAVVGRKIHTASVGDSRAFLAVINKKTGQVVRCHRLNKALHNADNPNEKKRVEENGGSWNESKQLNNSLIISRAFGGKRHEGKGISHVPDIYHDDIPALKDEEEGILILTSDGFTDGNNNPQPTESTNPNENSAKHDETYLTKKLNAVLSTNPNFRKRELAKALVESAREDGSVEDISVIAVPLEEGFYATIGGSGGAEVSEPVSQQIYPVFSEKLLDKINDVAGFQEQDFQTAVRILIQRSSNGKPKELSLTLHVDSNAQYYISVVDKTNLSILVWKVNLDASSNISLEAIGNPRRKPDPATLKLMGSHVVTIKTKHASMMDGIIKHHLEVNKTGSKPAIQMKAIVGKLEPMVLNYERLSDRERAMRILDRVKEAQKKGYQKVGVTYSANNQQTMRIRAASSSWDYGIEGGNQAKVMMEIEKLLQTEAYENCRNAFEILPITTSQFSGGRGKTSFTWLKQDLSRIQQFIKNDGYVIGLQDQNGVQDNSYAIGGGNSGEDVFSNQQSNAVQSALRALECGEVNTALDSIDVTKDDQNLATDHRKKRQQYKLEKPRVLNTMSALPKNNKAHYTLRLFKKNNEYYVQVIFQTPVTMGDDRETTISRHKEVFKTNGRVFESTDVSSIGDDTNLEVIGSEKKIASSLPFQEVVRESLKRKNPSGVEFNNDFINNNKQSNSGYTQPASIPLVHHVNAEFIQDPSTKQYYVKIGPRFYPVSVDPLDYSKVLVGNPTSGEKLARELKNISGEKIDITVSGPDIDKVKIKEMLKEIGKKFQIDLNGKLVVKASRPYIFMDHPNPDFEIYSDICKKESVDPQNTRLVCLGETALSKDLWKSGIYSMKLPVENKNNIDGAAFNKMIDESIQNLYRLRGLSPATVPVIPVRKKEKCFYYFESNNLDIAIKDSTDFRATSPYLIKITTGDASGFYIYDPKKKAPDDIVQLGGLSDQKYSDVVKKAKAASGIGKDARANTGDIFFSPKSEHDKAVYQIFCKHYPEHFSVDECFIVKNAQGKNEYWEPELFGNVQIDAALSTKYFQALKEYFTFLEGGKCPDQYKPYFEEGQRQAKLPIEERDPLYLTQEQKAALGPAHKTKKRVKKQPQVAPAVKKDIIETKVQVEITPEQEAKIAGFLNRIKTGEKNGDLFFLGLRLRGVLSQYNIQKMTVDDLIDALLKTKGTTVLAERMYGDGRLWTREEISYIGYIHNTFFEDVHNFVTDSNIDMVYTTGPLMSVCNPADLDAITLDDKTSSHLLINFNPEQVQKLQGYLGPQALLDINKKITDADFDYQKLVFTHQEISSIEQELDTGPFAQNQTVLDLKAKFYKKPFDLEKYKKDFEARYLHLFIAKNADALKKGKNIVLLLPTFSAGYFGGEYADLVKRYFRKALVELIKNHGDKLSQVAGIVWDKYSDLDPAIDISGDIDLRYSNQNKKSIKFITVNSRNDAHKNLVNKLNTLDDSFTDCIPVEFIAGDGAAIYGNDYNNGHPTSQEGAKSAVVDVPARIAQTDASCNSQKHCTYPQYPGKTAGQICAEENIQLGLKSVRVTQSGKLGEKPDIQTRVYKRSDDHKLTQLPYADQINQEDQIEEIQDNQFYQKTCDIAGLSSKEREVLHLYEILLKTYKKVEPGPNNSQTQLHPSVRKFVNRYIEKCNEGIDATLAFLTQRRDDILAQSARTVGSGITLPCKEDYESVIHDTVEQNPNPFLRYIPEDVLKRERVLLKEHGLHGFVKAQKEGDASGDTKEISDSLFKAYQSRVFDVPFNGKPRYKFLEDEKVNSNNSNRDNINVEFLSLTRPLEIHTNAKFKARTDLKAYPQKAQQWLLRAENKNKKCAILNLANAERSGGGCFTERGKAQEESLIHTSDAYGFMPAYPDTTRFADGSEHYGLDKIGYTYTVKNVTQYGQDQYGVLNGERQYSMIVAAGLDLRQDWIRQHATTPQGRKDALQHLIYIMRRICEEAKAHGIQKIGLGALGAGVFGNNPFLIAAVFRLVLSEYPGIEAEFPITDSNLTSVFNEVFEKASVDDLRHILELAPVCRWGDLSSGYQVSIKQYVNQLKIDADILKYKIKPATEKNKTTLSALSVASEINKKIKGINLDPKLLPDSESVKFLAKNPHHLELLSAIVASVKAPGEDGSSGMTDIWKGYIESQKSIHYLQAILDYAIDPDMLSRCDDQDIKNIIKYVPDFGNLSRERIFKKEERLLLIGALQNKLETHHPKSRESSELRGLLEKISSPYDFNETFINLLQRLDAEADPKQKMANQDLLSLKGIKHGYFAPAINALTQQKYELSVDQVNYLKHNEKVSRLISCVCLPPVVGAKDGIQNSYFNFWLDPQNQESVEDIIDTAFQDDCIELSPKDLFLDIENMSGEIVQQYLTKIANKNDISQEERALIKQLHDMGLRLDLQKLNKLKNESYADSLRVLQGNNCLGPADKAMVEYILSLDVTKPAGKKILETIQYLGKLQLSAKDFRKCLHALIKPKAVNSPQLPPDPIMIMLPVKHTTAVKMHAWRNLPPSQLPDVVNTFTDEPNGKELSNLVSWFSTNQTSVQIVPITKSEKENEPADIVHLKRDFELIKHLTETNRPLIVMENVIPAFSDSGNLKEAESVYIQYELNQIKKQMQNPQVKHFNNIKPALENILVGAKNFCRHTDILGHDGTGVILSELQNYNLNHQGFDPFDLFEKVRGECHHRKTGKSIFGWSFTNWSSHRSLLFGGIGGRKGFVDFFYSAIDNADKLFRATEGQIQSFDHLMRAQAKLGFIEFIDTEILRLEKARNNTPYTFFGMTDFEALEKIRIKIAMYQFMKEAIQKDLLDNTDNPHNPGYGFLDLLLTLEKKILVEEKDEHQAFQFFTKKDVADLKKMLGSEFSSIKNLDGNYGKQIFSRQEIFDIQKALVKINSHESLKLKDKLYYKEPAVRAVDRQDQINSNEKPLLLINNNGVEAPAKILDIIEYNRTSSFGDAKSRVKTRTNYMNAKADLFQWQNKCVGLGVAQAGAQPQNGQIVAQNPLPGTKKR